MESTEFSYTLCPHTWTNSIINIPHQSGAFLRISESILIHHYHSKSIIYIRVHSWCSTFYEFWQMCIMYVSTPASHRNRFNVLKILCALPNHLSLPTIPMNDWLCYCLHSFAFYSIKIGIILCVAFSFFLFCI